MDIKNVLEKFNNFADQRDWDQFHTVKNLSIALSVECAELLEVFQWASEEEIQGWIKDNPRKQQQIADEVADIFLYLIKIADKANVNLSEAIESKMQRNAEKYPVEKSKGNAKKYTEL